MYSHMNIWYTHMLPLDKYNLRRVILLFFNLFPFSFENKMFVSIDFNICLNFNRNN